MTSVWGSSLFLSKFQAVDKIKKCQLLIFARFLRPYLVFHDGEQTHMMI